MGIASILTIIFVIAKILGLIAWSWIWVFSPLWIAGIIGVLLIIITLVFATLTAIFD